MDFFEGVEDFGTAQEIIVSGVARVERITEGQIRVTYYVHRDGKKSVAVHHLWDRRQWYEMWALWQTRHEDVAQACSSLQCSCCEPDLRHEVH